MRRDPKSGSANTPKDREAARQHVEQLLAIGGGLPVLAHRDIGDILPQLQLELGADAALLVEVCGVEPSGPQGFDVRACRPAQPSIEPIRAYPGIAIRVGVGYRPVHQGEEQVPAPLVWRRLIGPSAQNDAKIQLLEVYFHTGAPQLVRSHQRELAERRDIGWRNNDDRLALITCACQRLCYGRMIARPAQDFDPGIIGKRCSRPEETDAVAPKRRIGAGQHCHSLSLVDRPTTPDARPRYRKGDASD